MQDKTVLVQFKILTNKNARMQNNECINLGCGLSFVAISGAAMMIQSK